MCRSDRAGRTLVELLVGMLALTIVTAAALVTFGAQSRLARTAGDLAEAASARRTAAAVLERELRNATAGEDPLAVAADSAALRIQRGVAIVCGHGSASVHVRYRGLRAPDPAKDSLLRLERAGTREHAVALAAVSTVSTPQCSAAPGEDVFALTPDSGYVAGDVLLVFERGTYALTSRALRYRRGAGGRQPLTAEVFLDDSTDIALLAARETVAVRVRLTAGDAARPSRGIAGRTIRLPLLNVRLPVDSLESP
jgi:hypothetical protein